MAQSASHATSKAQRPVVRFATAVCHLFSGLAEEYGEFRHLLQRDLGIAGGLPCKFSPKTRAAVSSQREPFYTRAVDEKQRPTPLPPNPSLCERRQALSAPKWAAEFPARRPCLQFRSELRSPSLFLRFTLAERVQARRTT